jgi:hypothetical protein
MKKEYDVYEYDYHTKKNVIVATYKYKKDAEKHLKENGVRDIIQCSVEPNLYGMEHWGHGVVSDIYPTYRIREVQ